MLFSERKSYQYSTELCNRQDTVIALKIHNEYVLKCASRPVPQFCEVDLSQSTIDPLWHQPLAQRQQFSRTFDIPSIVQFEKPDWKLTAIGLAPQQRYRFWMSMLSLRDSFDYFPCRGDRVLWNGYRLMITEAVVDPSAYWHQTNVWLGIVAVCQIVPDGDARPEIGTSTTILPSERSGSKYNQNSYPQGL